MHRIAREGINQSASRGLSRERRDGVAGTCPNCSILAAKVLDATSVGTDFGVAQGIDWSKNNGAKVINLSLGGPGKSTALENAVNNAWNAGVVVVAAAGNTGDNTTFYPGAFTNSIAVAATDKHDKRASFSTYGNWIDVAAPGVKIASTYPVALGSYKYISGTSMASPHVAGLAGLLASQGKTNSQARNSIETTAVDLGAAGKDQFYGNGRIDAQAAVGGSPPPPPPPPPPPDDGHSKHWFDKRINELQHKLHQTEDAGTRMHIKRLINRLGALRSK
jgi:thermitase